MSKYALKLTFMKILKSLTVVSVRKSKTGWGEPHQTADFNQTTARVIS